MSLCDQLANRQTQTKTFAGAAIKLKELAEDFFLLRFRNARPLSITLRVTEFVFSVEFKTMGAALQ